MNSKCLYSSVILFTTRASQQFKPYLEILFYFIVNFNDYSFHFCNFYLILFWICLHFSFSFEDNELLVLKSLSHFFWCLHFKVQVTHFFHPPLSRTVHFFAMLEVFELEFTYPQQAWLSMGSPRALDCRMPSRGPFCIQHHQGPVGLDQCLYWFLSWCPSLL